MPYRNPPSRYLMHGDTAIRVSSDHLPTARNIIYHHPTEPNIYLIMVGAYHREDEIRRQVLSIEKEIKQRIVDGRTKNELGLTADKVVAKKFMFKIVEALNEETLPDVMREIDERMETDMIKLLEQAEAIAHELKTP